MADSKKDLSERDICTKYITPALVHADWDNMTQLREEVFFTKGRMEIGDKLIKRRKAKKADYVLYYRNNFPIAIVEAKDNNHSVGDGMQQAMEYAATLDIPFAFSSNGDGFLEHDFFTGKERALAMSEFPSPFELYERYKKANKLEPEIEKIIETPYYSDGSGKIPRYYQQIAINRTVKVFAEGRKRILLVMATGTGKTLVAGQIIWRLWKAGSAKRILFLADRNILVDQTMTNDFKHFGDNMAKLSAKHGSIEYQDKQNLAIGKKSKKIDKAYQIYLGLYQSLTSNDAIDDVFKQFSPDFFDLIIVDECHRGSAAENSAWRKILTYFSSATHVGLTATPKETKDVSNIEYFGEPIYIYSLKQGIEDGFLAPYKVVQIMLDKDVGGYRPRITDRDREGREIEDRIYTTKDFDRNIVLTQRTKVVAKEITRFLEATDPFAKTIVFCVDIDHAERMRQALVNENTDLVKANRKYVMRITGDNDEGKAELDNFIDPESLYPTIVTTSKLMTTGVDAQTCKVIVLDSNINSMTEFKQIIGRGSRIKEEFGKTHFTILDFRKVTELFADPDFDGEPVQVKEMEEGEEFVDNEVQDDQNLVHEEEDEIFSEKPKIIEGGEIAKGKQEKVYIDGVPVKLAYKQTQYLGADGKLITESLKDYTKEKILQEYSSLDDFINNWDKHKKKYFILEELSQHGVMLSELQKDIGQDLDPFDLILHVAFGKKKLMTRKERANHVRKKNYFDKYSEKARKVLEALLDKYADKGIQHLEDINILSVRPFSQYGSPVEIIHEFGGRDQYLQAVESLEKEIYSL